MAGSLTAKQRFLQEYKREHATTMRVLRAYPADQMDLRPHPRCKTARELGWVFVTELAFSAFILDDGLRSGMPPAPPPPPDSWASVLDALEKAHKESARRLGRITDQKLRGKVRFFTAPKKMGEVGRLDFLWFMLFDEIHHRGQFSIYLRMAGGKVPSIYGPSADEPWM